MSALRRLFLLLLLLAVQGSWATEAPLKKVSLQLEWKHQFEFAGFYAAKEKGYYQQAGLEVSFFEYDGKSDLVQEVVEGRKTFGMAPADVVGRRLQGSPVVLLSNYFKRSPQAIVTQAAIRAPGDLKGKRFMATHKDLDGVHFATLFRKFGLGPSDMTIVPHSFNVQDFVTGKVDAMTVFITNEIFALQQSGVAYNTIDPGNYGIDLYAGNLFTTEAYASQHPDTVRAFKQASDRGWAYAIAHSDELVDIIRAKYNTQDKSRAALRFEAQETIRIMLPKVYAVGSIDPVKLHRVAESFVQTDKAKSLDRLEGAIFGVDAMASVVQKSHAQTAASIASSIQLAMWNMDKAAITQVLKDSLRFGDVVAIQTHEKNVDGKIFVAWRARDNTLNVGEYSALPADISQPALQKLSHPLIANGKEFDQITLYLSKPSGSLPLTAEEQAYLKAHPVIRVSNETDYPPFDFAIDGQPRGYSIDILNLLAQRIGLTVDYVTGPTWDELVQMHKQGTLDLLQSIYRTPQREKSGLYSDPYSSAKTVFVVRKGDSEVADFAQLQDKTVAVGKGWAQEEFLRTNYPEIKRLTVDSLEQMLDAISNGAADATFESDKSIAYWLRKKGINDVKVSGWAKEYDKGKPLGFYFYAQKDAPRLVSMLNKALASLTPGELQELQTKWFGSADSTAATKIKHIAFSPQQQAYLATKGQISMCVDPDWLPVERINERGGHEGIAADLMAKFSEKLGTKIVLLATRTWQETLDAAKSRRCDIISAAVQTPSRKAFMDFTTPYLSFSAAIVTRNRQVFIPDIELVLGETFGVVKGDSLVERLRARYPGIRLVELANTLEGLHQVNDGKLFGFIDALPAVAYRMQTHGLYELKVAGQLEEKWELSVATRQDEPVLGEVFQLAIAAVPAQERQAVTNHWMAVRLEQGFDYALLWKLGAGAAALFLGFFVWNRKLATVNKALHQAQETQRKTAQELLLIVDNAGVGIVMTDGQRRVVRMNHFCESVQMRCPPGAYIGESVQSTFVSDEEYQSFTDKVRSAGTSQVSLERTVLRRDGTSFLANAVGSFVDPADHSQGMIWFATDITEQRAAENKLAQTLSELETILNHAWIGVFVTSGERRIMRMNRYAEEVIFHCQPGDYIGQSTRSLFETQLGYEDFTCKVRAAAAANVSVEHVFYRKDGTAFLGKSVGSLLDPGDPGKGAIWLVTDITEQRTAEEQLAQTLKELEVIFQNASIGMAYAKNRHLIRVNRALADMLGYEEAGLVGQAAQILYATPESYDAVGRGYAVMEGGGIFRIEVPMRHTDGTERLIAQTGSLLDLDDPAKGSIWTYQDITEQRASEEKLAQTLKELEFIFQNAGVGIAYLVKRRYLRVNKTFEAICGYTAAELIGQSTRLVCASDAVYESFAPAYAALAAGQPSYRSDALFRRRDGVDVVCETTGSLVDPQHPDKGAIWLYADVTDLRRAQADLVEANRSLQDANSALAMSADTLRLLGDVGRDITANLDTNAVFSALHRHLNTLLDAFSFGIYRLSPDGETLLDVFRVEGGQNLPRVEIDVQDPLRPAARCVRERRELIIQKHRGMEPRPLPGSAPTLSQMFIPLMHQDQVLGVMTVQSELENAYSERDLLIFRTVCAYGAIAMANAESLGALRLAQVAVQNARDDAVAKSILIEQQHQTVTRTLDQITTLLDNSGQGFLTFGKDLRVDEGFSQECQRIFNRTVLDLPLPELLCPDDIFQRNFLGKTLPLAMDGSCDPLRRDAYLGLLPPEYRLDSHHYEAEYKVLGDARMMLILTDVSDARQLKEKLDLERKRLEFVVNALTDRDDLLETVRNYETMRSRVLPDLLSFERQPRALLTEVFRQIHTFKSLFAQASLPTAPQALHELETRLGHLRDLGEQLDTSDVKRALGGTDLGAALQNDLALLREKLGGGFFSTEREIRVPASKLRGLEAQAESLLDKNSRVLDLIRCLRYVPLRTLIEPHFKATEQLALRQDKQLGPISCSGDTALVDPDVYGPFCKVLVHVFRNAVDHGLEDADTRFLADKAEVASIRCEVRAAGDHLTLSIEDDGRGIDAAKLRARAVEQGLVGAPVATQATGISEQETLMLVFAEGLSTLEDVTQVSGRGVGLSAVQHELTQLGGTVLVKSSIGQGTRFEFTLPWQPTHGDSDKDRGQRQARQFLGPLPAVVKDFCEQHLKLRVTLDETLHAFSADMLHDFTVLVTLGSGIDATLGLSVQRALLLDMTRRFAPEFAEDEIEALADSVGAEIANTLFGKATVYFTHLQRQVALGTPRIVHPAQRTACLGTRAFDGFTGLCEAGGFIVFCAFIKRRGTP